MIIWTDRGNLLVKMCTNPVEHFVFTDSGFWKYSWAHLVM